MRESRVMCGTRRIHAAVSGNDAPPLLMLHGVTRSWRTFLPLWPSLSARWKLHAIDFCGHGNSDRVGADYLVNDYVEDAVAYLDAQIDSPVVVYGHSLGAMVAAAAATQLEDRVKAIVMEDPPFHTMGTRIHTSSLLSFFSALREFAGDERPVGAIAQDVAEISLINPQTGVMTKLGNVRDAASIRFTASCLKRLDPAVFDSIIAGRWLAGFDVESICSGLRCPALLIQADTQSGGMLSDADAAIVAESAADVTRVQIEDCGHLIHWSRTETLLNFTHGFLESCL